MLGSPVARGGVDPEHRERREDRADRREEGEPLAVPEGAEPLVPPGEDPGVLAEERIPRAVRLRWH